MKKDGIKIIIALILFFIALIVNFGNIWMNNILYFSICNGGNRDSN